MIETEPFTITQRKLVKTFWTSSEQNGQKRFPENHIIMEVGNTCSGASNVIIIIIITIITESLLFCTSFEGNQF